MSGRAAAALSAALALSAAAAAVAIGRDEVELDVLKASPFPSVDSTGPRGAAALFEWLAATGRRPLRAHGASLPEDAIPVLATPAAPLSAAEAEALLARARAGGLVIWAAGDPGSQPELESRLGVGRPRGAPAPEATLPLAPHPLVDGLDLSTPGWSVASEAPGVVPLAGGPGFTAVLSVPVGEGEVLVLAGAALLQNARIESLDNASFWARAARRGRLAFDEEHWSAPPPPAPASSTGLRLLVAQALLAALALAWARGRRLGAIRPPPPSAASRTAADYLASLAALYRRARAEGELAGAAWRAHRLRLQRRAGIGALLPDAAAASRLEASSPAAAAAFREAAALAGRGVTSPAELLALVRAAARVESALGAPAPRRGAGAGRGDAW